MSPAGQTKSALEGKAAIRELPTFALFGMGYSGVLKSTIRE
jgi:hypothetical protein